MVDYLDDNLRRLKRDLEGVNDTCLHWKIDDNANSIALTLWHMGRLLDVFLTRLVLGLTPEDECWFQGGWAERCSYDPRGVGRDGWGSLNEYTLEEVAVVPRFRKDDLISYLNQVYDTVRGFLQKTPMNQLAEPGAGFGGKFTKYQVISMALMDNVRHLGEIRLIKSLWHRQQG